jgi:hypothetical protein
MAPQFFAILILSFMEIRLTVLQLFHAYQQSETFIRLATVPERELVSPEIF